MSKIFEQIYLGSAKEASDEEWLNQHHITHIVNCAKEVKVYFPGKYSYMNLLLDDIPQQSLYGVLEKSFDYIRDAISRGGTVFIHCFAGISRSASVLIYFIMKVKKVPYSVAYNYVKDKRSIVQPNQGFEIQLISVSPEVKRFVPSSPSSSGSVYTEHKYGTPIKR